MKAQAIIPTAGLGVRMNNSTPKPMLNVNGKPIIEHTLRAFEQSDSIESIILVGHENTIADLKKIVTEKGIRKVKNIIVGGKERSDSVYNGLKEIDSDTDVVVIHDGVRPLIDSELLERVVEECRENDGVVVGVKIKSTLKEVDDDLTIKNTIDRSVVWEAQTPQAFKKDVIIDAHKKRGTSNVTDDSMLVEQSGYAVKMIEGSYRNIKITTEEDLAAANAYLREGK